MSSENIDSGETPQEHEGSCKIIAADLKIKDKQKDSNLKQSKLKLMNDKTSKNSRKNLASRRTDKDQQQRGEPQKPKHKSSNQKQDTPLECYVKMIEYLKKIEWDQTNQQNKMNPFHAMTATCFWFSICAEYYSYNFFGKRHGSQVAHEYLNRVIRMPVPICTRITKIIKPNGLLQFETEEFREVALSISQKLNHLIPAQLNNIKNDTIDKSSGVTSVADDDHFRSSTRAWIYNNLKGKIDSNDKWKAALTGAFQPVVQLAPRTVTKKIIQFAPDHKSEDEQQKRPPSIRQIHKKAKGRKPSNWDKLCQQKEIDQQQNGDRLQQQIFSKVKSIQPRSEQLLQNENSDNSQNQTPQNYDLKIYKQGNPKNPNPNNEKLQNSENKNGERLKDNIPGEESQYRQIMKKDNEDSKKQRKTKKQSQNIQDEDQESQSEEVQSLSPKETLFFTEKRFYTENDLLMDAILHLPLEKVISVLQSLLPKNNCPEVVEPFMKHPNVDPLDFVFQLHPGQEDYLEYMKQHRSSHLQRGRKRVEAQKLRNLEQEKLKKQKIEEQNRQQSERYEMEIQKDVKQESSSKQKESQKYQKQEIQLQSEPQKEKQKSDSHECKNLIHQEKIKEQQVNASLEDQQQDPKQFQDAKCQICTDGDYTDDNLIVFCSMCNISLHQKCVGLAKVPSGNWVCQLCTAFGPAGCNVPCPLCNVKGGALKRTNIHIDAAIWRENNPGYHQFTKKCTFNKQKEEYQSPQGNINQVIYYDYFKRSTYDLSIKPECHYVWCHYVCAIWIPQCYFEQKNGQINIKGIDNIQKKRFKLECYICRKERVGACVKCEEPICQKYYHPECARKKKVYMQQLNLQKLKYLIFCADHEPLKLTRHIQYKKKKQRDQIIKFCRMIEKYVETYKIAHLPFKIHKNMLTSASLNNRLKEQQNIQNTNSKTDGNVVKAAFSDSEKKKLLKNDDEQFIKNVVIQLQKNMMFVIHLEKVASTNPLKKNSSQISDKRSKNCAYKVTLVQEPSARTIKKCLSRYNQFWNTFTDGQEQKSFTRYDRIMNSNKKLRDKMENFLTGVTQAQEKNILNHQKKSNAGRKKKNQEQMQVDEAGCIYCVCKKPYQGETDMIQCEVCSEWYHFDCIGFKGGQKGAQQIQFHCMKCLKNQDPEKAIQILQKARGFFKSDAPYFSYRPPTPMLYSEQQIPEVYIAPKSEEKSEKNDRKTQHLLGTLMVNFQSQIDQIGKLQKSNKNSQEYK